MSKSIDVYLDYEPSPDIEVKCDAAYTEIKEWVLEKYGMKVSSLYVAQVKQKHGIIERENYNKPKTEGGRRFLIAHRRKRQLLRMR